MNLDLGVVTAAGQTAGLVARLATQGAAQCPRRVAVQSVHPLREERDARLAQLGELVDETVQPVGQLPRRTGAEAIQGGEETLARALVVDPGRQAVGAEGKQRFDEASPQRKRTGCLDERSRFGDLVHVGAEHLLLYGAAHLGQRSLEGGEEALQERLSLHVEDHVGQPAWYLLCFFHLGDCLQRLQEVAHLVDQQPHRQPHLFCHVACAEGGGHGDAHGAVGVGRLGAVADDHVDAHEA